MTRGPGACGAAHMAAQLPLRRDRAHPPAQPTGSDAWYRTALSPIHTYTDRRKKAHAPRPCMPCAHAYAARTHCTDPNPSESNPIRYHRVIHAIHHSDSVRGKSISPSFRHARKLGSCLALTPVETYASRHAPLAGVKREPGGRRLPPVVSQACSKPAAASRATVRPAAEAAPRAPLVTPGAAAPPLPRSGLHPRTPLLSSARCRIS